MYCDINFPTKKSLREAVKENRRVGVYQPNNFFGVTPPLNGEVVVVGPHFPKPHTWGATVELREGWIVRVVR